jgi:biopolymer transport protein ExbB/TolQ
MEFKDLEFIFSETYSKVIFLLLLGWLLFSTFYVIRLKVIGDTKKYNVQLYDSIPSIFTTLGVLGTFVGIFFGLIKFDVNNITESIPVLLEGMKTAFSTSIIGILLALIFSIVSKLVQRSIERKESSVAFDEISALNNIAEILQGMKTEASENANKLNTALIGETDESLSTQIVKVRNQLSDSLTNQTQQIRALDAVQKALGGDEETSLLTQIRKLRDEQGEYARETRKDVESILQAMTQNNELISDKFDEFSELLAKSNTEALVEVMKQATEEFNAQMKELIDRLVKENFEELNKSVQNMITWQEENKEMIRKLTEQFKGVSEDFKVTSESLQTITNNTQKLTDENSYLTKLIKELQEVMINDTKFTEITNKIAETVDTLKENTEAFDETTNKLNDWVRNQMNFRDSVDALLVRLEEIEKIRDINGEFWNNTKQQLEEGVAIIRRGNELLSEDLDNINQEFYNRLNDTLQNLDTLIQRIIVNYEG